MISVIRFMLWLAALAFSLGISSGLVSAQELRFPDDEGRHEAARFEAWTVFAHLTDATGQKYGVTITFFSGTFLGLPLNAVLLGLADPNRQEASRYSDIVIPIFERAQHTVGHLHERYGGNVLKQEKDRAMYTVSVQIDEAKIELQMTAQKPPMVLGNIPVGAERWAKTYSLPRNRVRGILVWKDREMVVTGRSLLEHTWGDSPGLGVLREWFGIHLDDGTDLVLYRLKGPSSFEVLGLSHPQGSYEILREFDLQSKTTWRSPKTGIAFPTNWTLMIPDRDTVMKVTPSFAGQELSFLNEKYWQGQCTVRGTVAGRPVVGEAFVYLKGYRQQQVVDEDPLVLDE